MATDNCSPPVGTVSLQKSNSTSFDLFWGSTKARIPPWGYWRIIARGVTLPESLASRCPRVGHGWIQTGPGYWICVFFGHLLEGDIPRNISHSLSTVAVSMVSCNDASFAHSSGTKNKQERKKERISDCTMAKQVLAFCVCKDRVLILLSTM